MPSLSRRSVLKGAAAGGLGLAGVPVASSCGRGRRADNGKKVLQFWAFTDTRIAWQKKAFELYKEMKDPDFEIEWIIFPFTQMHDKLLVTAQGGSGGPDIADVEIAQFSRFIKGDVLFHDLRPELEKMGEWDNLYHPSATDPWSFEGKTYGIGNELNACLLSYRWDVWEKAGVNPEISTWEEFTEEAKRFHDATGDYLLDQQHDDWGQWWIQTLQQGGGFFGPDGRPTLADDTGVRTLTWMQQALKDGWSSVRPIGQAYNVALDQGRIASLLGPSWNFSGFVQQNLPQTAGKWRLMPIPRWGPDGSRTATHGGTGVAVSKLSPYAEEALDFVLFEHTTARAVMYDFHERQVWPTYRPAFENEELTAPLKFFDNQRVGELIREVSPEINPAYTSPFWPETTDACVRLGLTPTLQNLDVVPREALARAQAETKEIIEFQTA